MKTLEYIFKFISCFIPVKSWRKKCRKLPEKIVGFIYKITPVKDNWVVFWDGMTSNGFGDNVKPVYEELKSRGLNFKCFFVAENDDKYNFLTNLFSEKEVIHINSKRFNQILLKSKYYIGNSCHLTFNKKHSQIWLQLWHGIAVKKVEFTLEEAKNWKTEKCLEKERIFSNHIHLSKGKKDTKNLQDMFHAPVIWEVGYPRTDIFFSPNLKDKVNKLKQELNISNDKKIILYAPTYRDGKGKTNVTIDVDKLKQCFGKEYVFLLRCHFYAGGWQSNFNNDQFVIDVTKYPETSDLLAISDVLITDYSSIMGDFACLKRPMIFFPYDFDEYSEIRGLFETYKEEMPGPLVYNTEELINAINNIDEDKKIYQQKYDEFYEKYCCFEDANAAKRVVDLLLEENNC